MSSPRSLIQLNLLTHTPLLSHTFAIMILLSHTSLLSHILTPPADILHNHFSSVYVIHPLHYLSYPATTAYSLLSPPQE